MAMEIDWSILQKQGHGGEKRMYQNPFSSRLGCNHPILRSHSDKSPTGGGELIRADLPQRRGNGPVVKKGPDLR